MFDDPLRGPVASAQGDRTREKLIAAAERLMANHGIDGVDLREIHAAAGQRNRSAIAYHFGDREGLVVPVLLADLARGVNRGELTVNQARRRVPTVVDAFVNVVRPNPVAKVRS